MGALYGLNRRPFAFLRTKRIVVDLDGDTTPAYAPLFLAPSGVPTNAVTGGVYFDSTLGQALLYNGTAWVPPGVAQVYTGAQTLTASDSGALCVFNAATGATYTLPGAAEGLAFDFIVSVTATSNQHRINCAAADFFVGTVLQGADVTFTQAAMSANGTTHNRINMNGTTTSGIIGDVIHVRGISGTQWAVWGQTTATGTEATIFQAV